MISMINSKPWTWGGMLRYGLVLLTLGIVTWNYYSFSHFVHVTHHFEPPHGGEDPNHRGEDPSHHDEHGHDNGHGRGGSFDNIHLKKDELFLYGLALPLLLLTLASLIWNPSTSTKGTTSATAKFAHNTNKVNNPGDVNIQKWTIICFLLPLLLVMLDGSHGLGIFSSNKNPSQGTHMVWNLYVKTCMSLMSPSGYAAIWALALFLIPVTKNYATKECQ